MRGLFWRLPFRSRETVDDLGGLADLDAYPALRERLQISSEVINPVFRDLDAQALAAQLSFRRLRVGLLLTTAVTAAFGALQSVLDSSPLPGIVVAVTGLAATILVQIESRQRPGEDYLGARARAEELRSLHFRFLSGQFDLDRVGLERRVAAIRHPLEGPE